MRLPKLAVAEKQLDQQFAFEKAASFDMETIVNTTKNSVSVYDDLAHYIFNQMAAVDIESEWNWLLFRKQTVHSIFSLLPPISVVSFQLNDSTKYPLTN